jgi:hypothetical protein
VPYHELVDTIHKYLSKGVCPQASLDAEAEDGADTRGLIKEESQCVQDDGYCSEVTADLTSDDSECEERIQIDLAGFHRSYMGQGWNGLFLEETDNGEIIPTVRNEGRREYQMLRDPKLRYGRHTDLYSQSSVGSDSRILTFDQ